VVGSVREAQLGEGDGDEQLDCALRGQATRDCEACRQEIERVGWVGCRPGAIRSLLPYATISAAPAFLTARGPVDVAAPQHDPLVLLPCLVPLGSGAWTGAHRCPPG
jgi:hypothetical protein